MFEKNEYDRSVNTFSNQGRLYQVEYAMKAVEQGCTTLGIQTKDGIILGAEKKISSKLQIPSSIENIMKINENTICTYSGLRSDARALIETARVEAASHWFNFNEPMPVEAISLAVCDVALSFAEKKKKQRQKNEYDRNVNTFSNQGRLYQVEYAMKAVEQGCTTLGIQLKDAIILGAEKKIASKLQIPSSIENIMKINENAICTYSGLRSDARALIETARVEAANHWFNFNEPMPVEAISLAVCDMALSFAEKKKKQREKNEKRVVSRPYGVAMLIAGIDTDGQPRLFKNDPSGNYVRYKACCIGQGGENGMSTLQSNYREDMPFDEAILLAGKVLKENLEQKN